MFSNSKMLNPIINHQNEIVRVFLFVIVLWNKSNYSKFYLTERITCSYTMYKQGFKFIVQSLRNIWDCELLFSFFFIDALCKRMNWNCLSWFGTVRRWSRPAPLGSSDSCPGRSGRDQPSGSPYSCCHHYWKQYLLVISKSCIFKMRSNWQYNS